MIRQSNTGLTLPIPAQIPTVPSLVSSEPIYSPLITCWVVLPHSRLASILAQTQVARMPGIPATAPFRPLLSVWAPSTSTTSVLQRMCSLRKLTKLIFKIAPFRTGSVLSSYTKSAPSRRWRCLHPVAIVGIMNIIHSIHVSSPPNLPDARSFLSTLSTVVQSGIQVLIWAGDAGK